MKTPRTIHAPAARPASIRAALRAGADKDRWGLPLGGFELVDWDDERHEWRPRRRSDAVDWGAEDNILGAVRLLLTSGVDPNPERPNSWTYGSPLEGAYSGRQVGLALLLLAAGTDPVSAFVGRPPTTTEISRRAARHGPGWRPISRRGAVIAAAIERVVSPDPGSAGRSPNPRRRALLYCRHEITQTDP